MRRFFVTSLSLVLLLSIASDASAGMGYPTISDFGRLRIKSLSFFLMAFLLFSGLFHVCWHQLRTPIPNLPILSFRQSLGMMFLWGLVFIVVLIMISGARELMTPGAWVKNGFTYRLANTEKEKNLPQNKIDWNDAKINSLIQLKSMLMEHAAKRSGEFPDENEFLSLSHDLRKIPGLAGETWIYLPGSTINDSTNLIVYSAISEKTTSSISLFVDGSIQILTKSDLKNCLQQHMKEDEK